MNAESFDLSETITPRSDQLNAEDVLSGPRTVTIEKVTAGSAEQPVNIHLVEFPGRPFKPSKTVRRILVAAWGPDASAYAGRRMTLYRDASVRFGGQEVGGIRISHLSNIDKRLTLALTVTRGRRAPHVVEPLPVAAQVADTPGRATKEQQRRIAELLDADGLKTRAAKLEFLQGQFGDSIKSVADISDTDAASFIAFLEQPADQATDGLSAAEGAASE